MSLNVYNSLWLIETHNRYRYITYFENRRNLVIDMTVYMNVWILILLSFLNFLASVADRTDNIASFEEHGTQIHKHTNTHTQIHFIRTLAVPPSCIADTCTESRFWRGQQKRDRIVFRPGFANFISPCDHETAIAITVTLGSLSIGYITKCCSWNFRDNCSIGVLFSSLFLFSRFLDCLIWLIRKKD